MLKQAKVILAERWRLEFVFLACVLFVVGNRTFSPNSISPLFRNLQTEAKRQRSEGTANETERERERERETETEKERAVSMRLPLLSLSDLK